MKYYQIIKEFMFFHNISKKREKKLKRKKRDLCWSRHVLGMLVFSWSVHKVFTKCLQLLMSKYCSIWQMVCPKDAARVLGVSVSDTNTTWFLNCTCYEDVSCFNLIFYLVYYSLITLNFTFYAAFPVVQ